MKPLYISVTLLLAFSAIISCDSPEDMQADLLCTPGQSDACACENGLEGAQVCSDDGMSYGECTCEEPTPACAPGEMDACVCDGQELGMRECGEDEAFGECVCESDSGNSEHIPGTQWVLRDKDGKAVPAVFEPVCPSTKSEQCDTSLDETSYPCVFIHYLDSKPIWISYDLTTGTPHDCYHERSSWVGIYDNSECKGIPYREQLNKSPYGDQLSFVDGKLYTIDMTKPAQKLAQTYVSLWENNELKCSGSGIPPSTGNFWQFEELSTEIINALPNYPYQITIE